MVPRRERPRCRKEVERVLAERQCTLEDLLKPNDHFRVSDAMRTQARKMIAERDTPPAR